MDALVAGAGIVGISVALHLQARGMFVALVDRREPAMEATSGNAGMIHGEAVFPLPFPRKLSEIIKFAGNNTPALHYHLRSLPGLAPFLLSYWHNSSSNRHDQISKAYAVLALNSVQAHMTLADMAGASAQIQTGKCLAVFRSDQDADHAICEAERANQLYDVPFAVVEKSDLEEMEPDLRGIKRAIHWRETPTVSDPHKLAKTYFELFVRRGGKFFKADSTQLRQTSGKFCLRHDDGEIDADRLIIAQGSRSGPLCSRFGYIFPLRAKRGYHMHYQPLDNARLSHTLVDRHHGFSIAPMARGIRLTTGIEFADINAPATPVQIERATKKATEIFPLGPAIDDTPWLGERPCLPDMLPVIGKAPDRDDIWFAFGHGHQGFTMGPVTGCVIAEMICGEPTIIDPLPYSPTRFL